MPDADSPQLEPFIRAITGAQGALRGYCLAALGHGEAAMEAWQRTNLTLWRKAAEWEPDREFLPWAVAVARYEVLGVLRDAARDRLVFDPDVVAALADTAAEQAAAADPRREALERCMDQLQPDHREVLSQHYLHGEAQTEIAARRGMNPGALKVMLLRLRRSLADCITLRMAQETGHNA